MRVWFMKVSRAEHQTMVVMASAISCLSESANLVKKVAQSMRSTPFIQFSAESYFFFRGLGRSGAFSCEEKKGKICGTFRLQTVLFLEVTWGRRVRVMCSQLYHDITVGEVTHTSLFLVHRKLKHNVVQFISNVCWLHIHISTYSQQFLMPIWTLPLFLSYRWPVTAEESTICRYNTIYIYNITELTACSQIFHRSTSLLKYT